MKATNLPANILLATDLGPRTDRAQDRALGLAKAWGARLTVVHALDALDAPNDQPARPTADGAKARAFRMLREQFENDVDVVVTEGKPDEVILQAAREKAADLIVTGVAGNDPIAQSLFGSATSTLIRKGGLPVLVVKKRGTVPYRRVVVATDLSDASAVALKLAAHLFDPSMITLLHVIDAPFGRFLEDRELYEQKLKSGVVDDARKFADAHLGSDAAGLTIEVASGDPSVLVADYAAQTDTDIVFAGTIGRTGIMSVLMGSVAVALVDEVPCDLLIVPSAAGGAPA